MGSYIMGSYIMGRHLVLLGWRDEVGRQEAACQQSTWRSAEESGASVAGWLWVGASGRPEQASAAGWPHPGLPGALWVLFLRRLNRSRRHCAAAAVLYYDACLGHVSAAIVSHLACVAFGLSLSTSAKGGKVCHA